MPFSVLFSFPNYYFQLIIYYWLFIGEKIIMIREVRGIFDICHNMQLTLAQLEMFVQSTANILEHLPLNKRSKVTPGPDLLKYEHWTMPLVFTNEEGWIFRTKFRRRKMLARPSSAFMIILTSCLHLQRKKIWMGDKRKDKLYNGYLWEGKEWSKTILAD